MFPFQTRAQVKDWHKRENKRKQTGQRPQREDIYWVLGTSSWHLFPSRKKKCNNVFLKTKTYSSRIVVEHSSRLLQEKKLCTFSLNPAALKWPFLLVYMPKSCLTTIKKIKPKENCKERTHYRMLTSNPLLILTCSLCWSPNKWPTKLIEIINRNTRHSLRHKSAVTHKYPGCRQS